MLEAVVRWSRISVFILNVLLVGFRMTDDDVVFV